MSKSPPPTPLLTLTKSELITCISAAQPQLSQPDVELAVNSILNRIATALGEGERIEIRGFGSMRVHYRPPRLGRNPKTGQAVDIPGRYVPHFKPGADLRKRVNEQFNAHHSRKLS